MTLEEKIAFGEKAYAEYQKRQEALQRELAGPSPIDLYFRYLREATWASYHRYWRLEIDNSYEVYIVDIATDQIIPSSLIGKGIGFPTKCKLLGFCALNVKSDSGKHTPVLDFINSGKTFNMECENGRGRYRVKIAGEQQFIPNLSRARCFSEYR